MAVVPVADGSCGRCGSAVTARSRRRRATRIRSRCSCAGAPGRADLAGGAGQLGSFMTWSRMPAGVSGACAGAAGMVLAGPGSTPARGARRVNGVLTAVRGMVVHAVAAGQAGGDLVPLLYEVADDRDLPGAARGEDGRMGWRMRARHRLHEPQTPVDRASDEEIVALLQACLSARDRLIVLLMARAGLRRGELCGLRRSDVHLLADPARWGARSPGRTCTWSAATTTRTARGPSPGGSAWCRWISWRCGHSTPTRSSGWLSAGGRSDFLLVNLFRGRVGARCARARSVICWLRLPAGRPGGGRHAASAAARLREQRRRCRVRHRRGR